jgi:hypothetical protein
MRIPDDDLDDIISDMLGGGSAKEVRIRITKPDGEEIILPLYRECVRFDPNTGSLIEEKQIETITELGGAHINPRDIAGFCAICHSVAGERSFVHCKCCGKGLGTACCAKEDPQESSDHYCPPCFRKLRVNRRLKAFGKGLLSPFIEWDK